MSKRQVVVLRLGKSILRLLWGTHLSRTVWRNESFMEWSQNYTMHGSGLQMSVIFFGDALKPQIENWKANFGSDLGLWSAHQAQAWFEEAFEALHSAQEQVEASDHRASAAQGSWVSVGKQSKAERGTILKATLETKDMNLRSRWLWIKMVISWVSWVVF